MSTLHATINALAAEFAHEVLLAIRRAPLEDLTEIAGRAPKRAARGKRIRRSPAQLEAFAARIVSEVRRRAHGMLAEELKRAMGVPPGNVGAKVFTIPLGVALASGKIKKRGKRRATTYYAA